MILAGGFWFKREITQPGSFTEDKEVIVEQGSSGRVIAQQLATQGIITYPDLFYVMLRLHPAPIQAGEYAIPAQSSMKDIAALLHDGKTIQRHFTLPEGLTVKQALILLNQNEYLTGTVDTIPEEGTLFPETYSFTRGESRAELIKRMQESQNALLDQLWEDRDESLPLVSKKEALTLASIVEKETGKPEERAKIAGLFYNRLKIGMPLQTDPTIVYVITDGLGHMGGKKLYTKSMQINSPYNTYKNIGLPPGPIANPGKDSLEAVFHPEHHDYLFFVADGTGGHVFSETLAGHNKNVTQWRKIKKEIQKK